MPNKEKNCKWIFGTQDDVNVKGPNNPTMMSFKDEDFHSLVRESIQNSLDAVDDKSQPVNVSFAVRQFDGMEYPSFFDLYKHIKGCLDKFPVQGEPLFKPMLSYFASSPLNQKINYLRITDSNTKGMVYDSNDANSGFYKFIAEGVAQDAEGAGGAFGFGKNAFWSLSPISTVFVSSQAKNGEVCFAGISKLCTHIVDGELLLPYGKYTSNGEVVLTKKEDIPETFIPKETGTSVFVLGINSVDEDALIKAVLRNFWMAIYKKKLTVKVEQKVIDCDHLEDLMCQYFDDENPNLDKNYEYNPRVFFEIVKKAEDHADDYRFIEEPVLMDGKDCKSKLYIHLKNDAQGQIVFMRSQLMTIYTERRKCKGAEGVFVCDSEEGNRFLRELEDYTHSSWSRKNYAARNHTNTIVATRALKDIGTFIQESVAKELQLGAQETEQVAGLDKILTITTPKGVDDKSKKDDIVDLENYKDKPKPPQKEKKDKPKTIRQPRQTKAQFDPQGRLRSNSGGRKKRRPLNPGPVKPGSLIGKSTESENGKMGIYAVPIDVSYRTWSQEDDNGNIWHVVRLFSDKDIENALVQLYAVDEEGKKMGLNIVEAGGYEIRSGEEFVDSTDFNDSDADSESTTKQVNNAISGVNIHANIPQTIKVRFNSSLKYSLSIDTDQIEKSDEK